MPELAILLARTLSISTFSTSLLKSLFQISAKFSLLLIVLLLAFKIIDSLWKAFSKRTGRTVFQNFLLSCQRQLCLWSSFPPKNILVLRSRLRQKFLWRLKLLLDSSFLVFKNLFLSFDVFIIAFLSSLVIILQLFERIYLFFFLEWCLSRTDNSVSLNFDRGAFVTSNNNSFFKFWQKLPFSKFL